MWDAGILAGGTGDQSLRIRWRADIPSRSLNRVDARKWQVPLKFAFKRSSASRQSAPLRIGD